MYELFQLIEDVRNSMIKEGEDARDAKNDIAENVKVFMTNDVRNAAQTTRINQIFRVLEKKRAEKSAVMLMDFKIK